MAKDKTERSARYDRPARLQVKEWDKAVLLLNSDARQEIMDLCWEKPCSIKDLSQAMKKNPGSIHNHVKKLYEAGFLIIVERRLINGIEEKKYTQSADFIDLSTLPEDTLPQRNELIGKHIKKMVLRMLTYDRQATVKRKSIRLSNEDAAYIRDELEKLRQYAMAHHVEQSDGTEELEKCTLIYAFGKEP